MDRARTLSTRRKSGGRCSMRRSFLARNRVHPYERVAFSEQTKTQYDEADFIKVYFEYISKYPSLELDMLRIMTTPLVSSTRISLPCPMSTLVPDCCLCLSSMGHFSVVDSTCEICGPKRHQDDKLGEPALILAYIHQINNTVDYKDFYTSIIAYAGVAGCSIKDAFELIIPQRMLFSFYYMFRRSTEDFYVLFRRGTGGSLSILIVFKQDSVHLRSDFLRQLMRNGTGFNGLIDVYNKHFILALQPFPDSIIIADPNINQSDIYFKSQDLNVSDELLSEYKKLYTSFERFSPPVP
ncbi:nuclear egress lamina protein [Testudinid alphaherpesvirus 3]|uniref:Nuclear egress lamina protein n=1 Tax=Testudinid alphaherpesvirus 3 TaxID=2560801 RepID=A0A0K1R1D1_9ALPH|nr:nuclear egress lamina protein [Testudinid alphaherpesvirus 3]AIU39264.1 nuclear egress lamina protein [Testudinid alphaherpesvirus 3]AIU39374.1 nuclear egress lamina protein [Testudinid alphaherpesvirus 3]AKI81650.1 nuclear egress lamina protein [Testudinid alphaherpesvirus 3]AKI81753.1 nuclear egress lamina protein [Testudinid alphaherpesvirus 3]AKV40703.1 nuclear matrix protein [Testudinid alphaherpesvirus 3]